MAGLNTAPVLDRTYTHGGAIAAAHDKAPEQLWRAVGATLLWEPTHYEAGTGIAKRIVDLVREVDPYVVQQIAMDARTKLKLRHVPLWVAAALAYRYRGQTPPARVIEDTIAEVVRRPDEITELTLMYWLLNGRAAQTVGKFTPHKRLTSQVKRGLARAFGRFNEYQLAKYDRAEALRLRDVLFLVHAKPRDAEQAALWKRLVDGKLATPDTWEVNLSTGKDKRETWERLLQEKKLGYMALLKNLRNMLEVGIEQSALRDALLAGAKGSGALPYEFISAARAVPKMEAALSDALAAATADMPKLCGRTLLVVDVSGSMQGSLGGKSKLNRLDAAGGLAVAARALCDEVVVYATAGSDYHRKHQTKELPDRPGLGFLDAAQRAVNELGGGGIFLKQAMDYIGDHERSPFKRVLVFTDEQDCDTDPAKAPSNARKLGEFNYIMNVASYEHGIATDGGWERISGFSEAVLNWISFNETGETLVSFG